MIIWRGTLKINVKTDNVSKQCNYPNQTYLLAVCPPPHSEPCAAPCNKAILQVSIFITYQISSNKRQQSTYKQNKPSLPPRGGIAIRRVCWFVRSLVCICVRQCVCSLVRSLTSWAEYLENSWRKRLGSNGQPTGNGLCDRFATSRDGVAHAWRSFRSPSVFFQFLKKCQQLLFYSHDNPNIQINFRALRGWADEKFLLVDMAVAAVFRVASAMCLQVGVTDCTYQQSNVWLIISLIGETDLQTSLTEQFPTATWCHITALLHYIHRVRKERVWSISGITSSNTNRLLKFFHCYNLLKICNKAIVKYPTTPQTRHYTTL